MTKFNGGAFSVLLILYALYQLWTAVIGILGIKKENTTYIGMLFRLSLAGIIINIVTLVLGIQQNPTLFTEIILIINVPFAVLMSFQVYKMRSFLLGNLNNYKYINDNDIEFQSLEK